MRDYALMVKILRSCAENSCEGCPIGGAEYTSKDCRKVHNDAADAIEELLAELTTIRKQLPRWISVEKPPNDERNVFICHGNADFKAPCIGHYDASMKRFYEDKNWFASPIYDAMFWCEMPKLPLPTPPKEDAECKN